MALFSSFETFVALGAKVRWCSFNVFSMQDHAAVAIAKAGTSAALAWKGESSSKHWWSTEQMMIVPTVPGEDGCDQFAEDGGDAYPIHKNKKFEEKYIKDGSLLNPVSTTKAELRYILQLLADFIDKIKYTCMTLKCKGVSHEITSGVHCHRETTATGEQLSPAINVNDYVTKLKFDYVLGCHHSLLDSIVYFTDAMIGGKRILVYGYSDVGRGCAISLRGIGAYVLLTENDPINAPVYIENNTIACDIGHFETGIDNEDLEPLFAVTVVNIKPQAIYLVFPGSSNGIIVLTSGRLMSCSFINQILAQLT
eukprot:CAMPEP_0115084506 /NCGR_PEP_ID=MMETSP0227-20121206/21307_1 /TAXON_ID=89957 /ORGANISM="Polarella glacialis, Strain CCMP 1383" /LENGTH=309 /DNA_ID=CAMNT_0002473339 /DNA_START=124 /DNA_END=1053 /DNA_ORIENTATION=+